MTTEQMDATEPAAPKEPARRKPAARAGTVVATLKMPLPVNQALVRVTAGLEQLYGEKLVLMPTEPGADYVKVAVA
jgi:hypothetical protein